MDESSSALITSKQITRCRAGRRPASIGRRALLQAAAGAGVAAVGVGGRGIVMPWLALSRSAEAAPLVEPAERVSANGLLDTTIEARVQPVPVGGRTVTTSVYEGAFPGPTLRVKPGDRLRINLVNQLNALPDGLPANSPFICRDVAGVGHSADSHDTTCDT